MFRGLAPGDLSFLRHVGEPDIYRTTRSDRFRGSFISHSHQPTSLRRGNGCLVPKCSPDRNIHNTHRCIPPSSLRNYHRKWARAERGTQIGDPLARPRLRRHADTCAPLFGRERFLEWWRGCWICSLRAGKCSGVHSANRESWSERGICG